MRIIVVAPKNKTILSYRVDLIKDMISNGHEVMIVGPDREYVDDLMAIGISEFIEVPIVCDNTSVMGDLRYLFALKKVFKEKKPDLVFGYTIKPVIYGSLAAKAAKVPHIYSMVTGLGRIFTSSSLKAKMVKMIVKMLYKRAFKACDKVIFQNGDDIKELVSERYLPESKCVKVNGSGVNMENFSPAPLPEKPTFLMVGRIIREKGVLEYCEAARAVKKDHPDARFILLGGFDTSIGAIKREDIQGYIDDGSIEFPGEVKDPIEYYKNSSAFVLPSYYGEGLPKSILEAMSCGRAIITTDWTGCREPIIDGENGYLIPIKDVSALIEKINLLIEDRELLAKMGENAHQTCKERFEVSIINKAMRETLGY